MRIFPGCFHRSADASSDIHIQPRIIPLSVLVMLRSIIIYCLFLTVNVEYQYELDDTVDIIKVSHNNKRGCIHMLKKIFTFSLALVMMAGTLGLSTSAANTPSSWAATQVYEAIALNLVPIYLRWEYTKPVTRAEFCSLAVRLYEDLMHGLITGETSFIDTDDVNVSKAAFIGVVKGVGEGRFDPDATLTREQAATMLARLADSVGKPLAIKPAAFADNSSISAWALEAVGQCQAAAIMEGVGENKFSPADAYTREQSIATMLRLYKALNGTGKQQPEAVDSGRPTIYVIAKAMGSMYSIILQGGAIDAGREFDANVIITGIPDEASIEEQITILQNSASAKADAILIAVAHSEAEAFAVEKVYNTGIPIILIDTMANTDKYTSSFTTDNVEAGRSAAKELIRLLKEKGTPENAKGTVAVQIGITASKPIIDRLIGFREYWNSNAPANWVIDWDNTQVNDGDISKALFIARNFLTSYTDLIAFFTPNNGSTIGGVTALVESNRTDITMIGFDFSKEMEDIIRSGSFNASTIITNQYFMGYNGVKAAVDIINGGSVPKDNDTGVTVVNASNIDSPEVSRVVYGNR